MRQKQALAVMTSGANVFLTGAPGAGKTYVLNQFVKRAARSGKRVAVTASTGIAASHLNGTTIHSWSGLGILDSLSPEDLKRLGGADRLIKRYNATDILVIDEVSMLHGARLDMINQLAKVLRANDKPYGGMQVILVGDLFQLPPVSRGMSGFDFAHMSAAWSELDLQVCYITEQHRQQNADGLLELLEAMRDGSFDTMHHELLTERTKRPVGEGRAITRLYSHNIDVESINQKHLNAIEDQEYGYEMTTKGAAPKIEQLAKGLLAPPKLLLKVGAEVMFVANNFGEGFVNGSRGMVVAFENKTPQVRLTNGRVIDVAPHTWSLTEDGRVRAEISQLPLRLAWAITIHKSQGMSLDAAEIDLSRAFTPGMGYVALSRVRSLDGLYLQGFNDTALRMHPEIYELDRELRHSSNELAEVTDDIAPEPVVTKSAAPTAADEMLFDSLKQWRLLRAREDKVAPFIIAHNTALQALAATQPTTKQAMLGVAGFGQQKVATYGDDILAVISAHINSSNANK
jgi:ATP-dependent DNA helicase PIF1